MQRIELKSEQEIFAEYKIDGIIQELRDINKKYLAVRKNQRPSEWKKLVMQYFKELFAQAMEKNKIGFDQYEFAVCICGSLAKEQATPFSDLDCFIITKDATTTDALKPVVHDLKIIFDKIFQETDQLCMDPIGINLHKFIGTPEELTQQITGGNVADPDSFFNSVMSAAYIFGHSLTYPNPHREVKLDYLEEFKSQLKDKFKASSNTELTKRYYKLATEEFTGPRARSQVNIKSDLFRPLDFILMALRFEAGIEAQDDNSHLNALTLVKKLRELGKVGPEIEVMVKNIYEKSMALRIDQHLLAKSEQDMALLEIPSDMEDENNSQITKAEIEELRVLIDQVAILRGIAKKRLEMIEQGKELDSLPPFAIEDFMNPEYADKTFAMKDMVLSFIPIMVDLMKKDPRKILTYSRIANALQQRKAFLDNLDALDKILIHQIDPLRTQLQTLIKFLKETPLKQSQIETLANFTSSLVILLKPNTTQTFSFNVEQFQKCKEKVLNLGLNIPELDISSNTQLIYIAIQKQVLESIQNVQIRDTVAEQLHKISVRVEATQPPNFENLILITSQFIHPHDNAQKNTVITYLPSTELQLINVITGLNYLETYGQKHKSRFNPFHTKQESFKTYIAEMESILAKSGPKDALAYLFTQYHAALSESPKSDSTKIIGIAVAKCLGIQNPENIPTYHLYTEIMSRVHYASDLNSAINSYIQNVRRGFFYPFSRESKEASLKPLTNAQHDLTHGQNVTHFDFPSDAWSVLNDDPMHEAQLRALLRLELDRRLNALDQAYNSQHPNDYPNLKSAINKVKRLSVNLRDNPNLENSDFPLILKAIELATSIVSQENPKAAPQIKDLNALIQRIRNVPELKPFVRFLKVFTDHEHFKRKLLQKLDKKIAEWWHIGYGEKRRALRELRDEIAKNPDQTAGELRDATWAVKRINYKGEDINYAELMHKQRYGLFCASDEKTATEEFLDSLKKYDNVSLKP